MGETRDNEYEDELLDYEEEDAQAPDSVATKANGEAAKKSVLSLSLHLFVPVILLFNYICVLYVLSLITKLHFFPFLGAWWRYLFWCTFFLSLIFHIEAVSNLVTRNNFLFRFFPPKLTNFLLSFPSRGYVGIHSSGFRDFLLKPELLRAIVDSGFEHPSEG